MSRHPQIINARHAQGLAAYRAGHSIKDIVGILSEFELMHDQPDLTTEQHEEIQNAGPSLIAGFADGLIDDLRTAVRARRGVSA